MRYAIFNRFEVSMSLADAMSVSQPGKDASDDVDALLLEKPDLLAGIDPDDIRAELSEYGAWDEVELADDVENRFRIGADALIEIHPFDSHHPPGQSKSTAIALLTDQLPQWYAYVQSNNIPVKYSYKPREGGPHDGFVALDPGGYLLEFEEFKQHPENERLMAVLADVPKVHTTIENLYFFGSITWTYHKDLLRMQQYYEEVLGYPLVADQGWTKIYQTSPTGFIGLVDERRGMEDYAEEKAVELEWGVLDFQGLLDHAPYWSSYEQTPGVLTGPEGYRYRLSRAGANE